MYALYNSVALVRFDANTRQSQTNVGVCRVLGTLLCIVAYDPESANRDINGTTYTNIMNVFAIVRRADTHTHTDVNT